MRRRDAHQGSRAGQRGLEFQPTLPEVDPFNFAPRVRQPTLMLNGRYDFAFPVETSQLPLFQLLGTAARTSGRSSPRAGTGRRRPAGEGDDRLARPLPGAGADRGAVTQPVRSSTSTAFVTAHCST